MASLQYFVGYPLRVLVAEATRWLMLATHGVSREGAALVVDGHLVLVDAACSGVQLAWMGYFSAACLALLRGLDSRRFLGRLPWVGAWVLGGNIVRNWVLVALQGDGQPLAAWLHEGIGLVCLAGVCAGIAAVMRPAGRVHAERRPRWPGVANRLRSRLALKALCLGAMPLLALAQWTMPGAGEAVAMPQAAVEWPRTWQGKPLRPLALGAVEQRFAAHFPGRIARLTNDEDLLIWRHVTRPTRMLHPAADCYRALGYRVSGERLEAMQASAPGANGALWRCFTAEKNGQRLRVCEQLQDAAGRVFTDTSAWYWAAALGRSSGPWQAITVAQAM
jgi:exosortase/archaeosortase family protein